MNLKYWLAVKNMTALELHKAANLNYDTVRDIANGKVNNPNPRTLHKLANGLGIEVSQLLKGE